jgi:hypothetical protein
LRGKKKRRKRRTKKETKRHCNGKRKEWGRPLGKRERLERDQKGGTVESPAAKG